MPESLTLSAAKLDAFVKAVNSAPPGKLEEMAKRAKVEANDYAHPANIRKLYGKLATLLRAEIKGWKRNPAKRKTPRKKNPAGNRGVGSYELSAAWGDEYNNLTAREKDALLRDFRAAMVAEGMIADDMADAYVKRIYRGNLKSYVKTLLTVPKGRKKTPRKKRASNPATEYIVFNYSPQSDTLAFLNVYDAFAPRSAAARFASKAAADKALKRGFMPGYQHGIASAKSTAAQIRQAVKGRASSARGK